MHNNNQLGLGDDLLREELEKANEQVTRLERSEKDLIEELQILQADYTALQEACHERCQAIQRDAEQFRDELDYELSRARDEAAYWKGVAEQASNSLRNQSGSRTAQHEQSTREHEAAIAEYKAQLQRGNSEL